MSTSILQRSVRHQMNTARCRASLALLLVLLLSISGCAGDPFQGTTDDGNAGAQDVPTGSTSGRPPSQLTLRGYWPTDGWRTATPDAEGLEPAALVHADTTIRAEYPNVYSLLVVRHGYLIYERYYQHHDPADTYNVKSITKSVTSSLIGIALERNKIRDLDQTLSDFLPGYLDDVADPRVGAITLRQLLMMNSGFAWTENDIAQWFTSGDWIRFTLNRPLAYSPGEHFNYDTPASHLLSAILTQATGMPEADFAQRYLFNPLGISRPYWPTDPQGNSIGSSELFLTSRELARFGYLYLNAGIWDGKQVVPETWVRESVVERHPHVGFFGDAGYGYLWWITHVAGHDAFFALGYGAQYVYVVPDLDLVIVITANSDIAPDSIKDPAPLIQDVILPAIDDSES